MKQVHTKMGRLCCCTLPPEVKNKIQPAKEHGDGAHLQLIACLTVAWWDNEHYGSDIANPLSKVYDVK